MISKITKVYANALFELAHEKGQLDSVQKDFEILLGVLKENPTLISSLSVLSIPLSDKQKLVRELVKLQGFQSLLSHLLELLLVKNRISLLEGIYDAFLFKLDELQGVVRGTVATVEPLTSAEKDDLTQAFAKKMNKKVILESVLDKTLLGGLVVQIQGLTFDGSLKTTIHRLKENLERQSI